VAPPLVSSPIIRCHVDTRSTNPTDTRLIASRRVARHCTRCRRSRITVRSLRSHGRCCAIPTTRSRGAHGAPRSFSCLTNTGCSWRRNWRRSSDVVTGSCSSVSAAPSSPWERRLSSRFSRRRWPAPSQVFEHAIATQRLLGNENAVLNSQSTRPGGSSPSRIGCLAGLTDRGKITPDASSAAARADRVDRRWPRGRSRSLRGCAASRAVRLVRRSAARGAGVVRRGPASSR